MIRSVIRAYRQAFSGLPATVWLLAGVALVNRSGTMVIPFWALYCTSERGISPSGVSVLLALYGLGSIFGSYLGGVCATRFGPLRTQVTSLLLTAAAFLCLLSAPNYVVLALFSFLTACAADALRPANATAIANHCPQDLHPRAMALARLAINLGMSIGPVAGGFLASINFAWLFYADAATCAAAAACSVVFFRDQIAHEKAASNTRLRHRGQSPWRDKQLLIALALLGLTATVFFQFLGSYVLYFRDVLKFEKWQIGCLLAINTISIVLFEMLLIHRVQRYDRLKMIGWGCFFSCVGFGVLPFGSGLPIAVISICLWTFGEMLALPLAIAYVSTRADTSDRGRYLGLHTMCFAIAFVIAPLVGMPMYQWNPNALWFTCLVIGCIVLAGYYGLSADRTSAGESRV